MSALSRPHAEERCEAMRLEAWGCLHPSRRALRALLRMRAGPAARLLQALGLAVALLQVQSPLFAQSDLATLANYQGADRAQRLIDGAKREGELMIYSSMQHESIAPLQRAFEDKYGVKIRIWGAAGK